MSSTKALWAAARRWIRWISSMIRSEISRGISCRTRCRRRYPGNGTSRRRSRARNRLLQTSKERFCQSCRECRWSMCWGWMRNGVLKLIADESLSIPRSQASRKSEKQSGQATRTWPPQRRQRRSQMSLSNRACIWRRRSAAGRSERRIRARRRRLAAAATQWTTRVATSYSIPCITTIPQTGRRAGHRRCCSARRRRKRRRAGWRAGSSRCPRRRLPPIRA